MATVVAILCAVGIAAAVARGVVVASWLRLPPAERPEFSALDDFAVLLLPAALGLDPVADAAYIHREEHRFFDKYVAYPPATFLHVVPGALFLLVVPLQFSARIRARRPRFHRWSGRLLVTCGAVIGGSALFFGVLHPTYGTAEAVTIAIFGIVFFVALTSAVVAIRRRDVTHHREWMIRVFAVGLAISTIRIVSPLMLFVLRDLRNATLASFWVGWLLTLGVAELWIRRTRPGGALAALARTSPPFSARVGA